ncbi:MAG: hypothetical protein IID40_03850, partial [Planctomycetes bacterium]|nr:hypothetical protein [Planctomycetota bacterium]
GAGSRAAAAVPLGDVLNHGRARRNSLVVLGALAVFTVAFVAAPGLMGIWFDRSVLLGDTPWPQRTRLVVEVKDGVLRGARGDDLEVRAFVPEGYQAPRLVEIVFAYDSGTSGRANMIRVGERGYRYVFGRVAENFEFYLQGGDDRTALYRAELADRPAIERATVGVTPPAYAQLRPYELAEGIQAVELLPGSVVVLAVATNKPVRSAKLMSGGEVVAEATGQGQAWRVTLRPERSQTLHFALVDEVGLENANPVRFAMRMLRDEAPRVRMKLPGVGDMVTGAAVLRAELAVVDDYGLAAVQLVYQIEREGEAERVVEGPDFEIGAKRYEMTVETAVASLEVVVGDRISLFGRAMDRNDVSGPGEGRSTAVTLRVVTRDEMAAELARREQEYRRDFEGAVEAQEDLRRRLLTAIGQLPAASGIAAERAGVMERRQRQIAMQVNGIRQQFEDIWAQMRVNRLDNEAARQRLGEGIIGPLARLAKRDLAGAADAFRRLGRAEGSEAAALAAEIDGQQVRVLGAMRAALAQMVQWEGFQETVTMLREILRLQAELKAETEAAIERQGDEVFDGLFDGSPDDAERGRGAGG